MAGLTATFGFPYNSQFVLSGHSCCDSGTGQLPRSPHPSHVCSCQLEQVLQQKMNAAIPLGLIPRANFSAEPNLVFGPTAREPSAVYSPLVRQCDIKEMNGRGFNSAWYPNTRFEHPNFEQPNYLACHRFGDRFSPIDLNSGARRKNATRETTSTLKAWLYEHRKNPYPTKGEKIMLAILTKMTLTQVSTWFANARRRLKKENKMTWSPRNRCGERKDSEGYSDDDDVGDDDENEKIGEDVAEKRESLTCRQTTVIKAAEDANNVWRTDPALSRLTSKIEAFTPELKRRDIVTPQRSDQRIIWPNERSPTETDRASPQHASPLQDSPVKSLRKWVDGCFDENRSGTVRSPLTDTPPLTPPSETERLPERVIHSTKKQTPPPTRNSLSAPFDVSAAKGNEERASDHEEDGTTNREIDAALALTTLFSRN